MENKDPRGVPKKRSLWPAGAMQARKAAKAEKAAAELANEEWNRDHVRSGSKRHEEYLDKLVYDMSRCQADFMTYDTDVAKWLDPKLAKYDMDLRNVEYCRNMFDYCISPLQHGVDADSIVSCLGLYVGMGLFSKDFKRMVKTEVTGALLPVIDKLGANKARARDRHIERDKIWAERLERVTGHEIPILSARARKHESGENMTAHDERIQDMRDRVTAGRNGGRLPFTPETAGIQYLNFMHQYYHAVREPDVDVEALNKQFTSCMDTFWKLCEQDGVEPDSVALNSRIIAGHVMAVEPALQCEFEELGYEDYKKSTSQKVKSPVGKCFDVWRGEFEDANGVPLDGPLTIREPQDMEDHQAAIEGYFNDLFKAAQTMDDVTGILNDEKFEMLQYRFLSMMEGDFRYFDSQERHVYGEPKKTRNPQEVLADALVNAGKTWQKEHVDAAKSYADAVEAEALRKREARSNWGQQFDFEDAVQGLSRGIEDPGPDGNTRGGPNYGA